MNKKLNFTDKIFVCGHRGLIGSAIVENLDRRGYKNLVLKTRDQLDLLNQNHVKKFFETEKPDAVVIAAAKVGGILANSTFPAEFIFENTQIQNNVIWQSHISDVKRLVFLGSSCIYPRNLERPIHEGDLLAGPLESTNRAYSIAKINGLELVNSIRLQYGREYFSVMPTNLYGPKDNFDPNASHVIPALIRKVWQAKRENRHSIEVWGSGTPKREFLYSEDCADAIVHLLENLDMSVFLRPDYKAPGASHINVGFGTDISIADIAKEIMKAFDHQADLTFDSSKPDGTKRKLLDTSILRSLGWTPAHTLDEGMRLTRKWCEENVSHLMDVPGR